MLVIGLTGGIASGKSRLADLFRMKDVPVVDADEVAREVVRPGQAPLAAIVQAFGERVLRPDGTLHRKRLAEIIFSDAAARKRLEAIMHPAILGEMQRQIQALRGRPQPPPIVIAVLPLLFEAHCQPLVDGVAVAWASGPEQTRRLMARDGLTRQQALERIRTQMPLEEKAARADWVINTEADEKTLETQVEGLIAGWRSGQQAGAFQGQEGPQDRPAK